MRLRLGLVALTVAVLVLPAQAAAADGGAYIQFDRTHYIVGSAAHGVAYVAIPEPRQDLLARGPFNVYLVPGKTWIQEGRPLPEGVIKLGTATIEHDSRTAYRISTSFTVPDLPGDFYTVQLCNEPCTISGFRESLSGQISIVQTLREAALLNEQQRLFGKNWHLRRQVRKANKEAEDLQLIIDAAGAERRDLLRRIDDLQAEIARDQRAPEENARPLAEGWALVAIAIAVLVSLVAVTLGIVFSRRHRPTLVVPDTIAELDKELEDTLART